MNFIKIQQVFLYIYLDCKKFALRYKSKIVAVISHPEIYEHRKEERAARQFGTTNQGHPYIKVCLFVYIFLNMKLLTNQNCFQMIYESGDWLVGGEIEVYERITWNDGLDQYRYLPTK